MDNFKGVSDTNGVHKVNSNACYMSYDEANRATIKSSVALLQECFEVTNNSEVTGRDQNMGLPRSMELSNMVAVTGDVRQSDRV